MLKIIIFSLLVVCYFAYVTCIGGIIIALGEWRVLNVRTCPDDENYRIKYDVRRRKVNRTTDGFDMWFYLKETIDETYAVVVEVCVYVDGGCKPYQVMTDNSFEGFLKRHARDNLDRALRLFELEPPDFPIKPGNFGCNEFLFDYRQLPKHGVIGKYGAKGYLIKDIERVACADVTIEFFVKEGDLFFNM